MVAEPQQRGLGLVELSGGAGSVTGLPYPAGP
jgi:hypothetical protein